MNQPVRIELLHHEDCPLVGAARRVVHDCIRELDITVTVTDRVARYPSPSVLINGIDVMGAPADNTSVDVCRLDPPTRERVAAALRSASEAV